MQSKYFSCNFLVEYFLHDITDPTLHFTVMTPCYSYRTDFTVKITFISLDFTQFLLFAFVNHINLDTTEDHKYTEYCSVFLPFFSSLLFPLPVAFLPPPLPSSSPLQP